MAESLVIEFTTRVDSHSERSIKRLVRQFKCQRPSKRVIVYTGGRYDAFEDEVTCLGLGYEQHVKSLWLDRSNYPLTLRAMNVVQSYGPYDTSEKGYAVPLSWARKLPLVERALGGLSRKQFRDFCTGSDQLPEDLIDDQPSKRVRLQLHTANSFLNDFFEDWSAGDYTLDSRLFDVDSKK